MNADPVEILPIAQTLYLVTGISLGIFGTLAQIRLMLKTKTGLGLSFAYQLCVWINAVIGFIVALLIILALGFWQGYGQLLCSIECIVLVGIILLLKRKYDTPLERRITLIFKDDHTVIIENGIVKKVPRSYDLNQIKQKEIKNN